MRWGARSRRRPYPGIVTTSVEDPPVTNVLLYDADCAFCQRTASLAPRLGLAARVAASQEVDLGAAGVDPARALVEVPFVTASGEVLYGHEAIAAALRTGGPLVAAAGRFIVGRPQTWVFARIYRWIARNRHRLPGGTAACAMGSEVACATDSTPAFAMDGEVSGVPRTVVSVHPTAQEYRETA